MSDVIIRNMETPKLCCVCRFFVKGACYANGYRHYHPDMNKGKPDDCPLIELPPHGRLIDADALIDTLGTSDRDIYCKCVIEEDAPTVIEGSKE